MSEFNPGVEHGRSLGFWHTDELEAVHNSVLALAGAGGDGGAFAEQAVRAGFGEVRLADPEPFEDDNLNRQAFSNKNTVGRNKAEVVAEGLLAINPDLKVSVFKDGVTEDNIEEFVRGADIVVDETEFTHHWLGVMIARAAREEGVSNLMGMNVGFAGTVTGFRPNGYKFEEMLGLDPSMPLDEIKDQEVDLSRWLPYVPPYTDLNMFQEIAAGNKSAPSVQVGVGMAASMLCVESQLYVIERAGLRNNRPMPIEAPAVRFMDAMTGESGTITDPVASFNERMATAMAANESGSVPRVSYYPDSPSLKQ